jgi:hypothetical protein
MSPDRLVLILLGPTRACGTRRAESSPVAATPRQGDANEAAPVGPPHGCRSRLSGAAARGAQLSVLKSLLHLARLGLEVTQI